MVRFLILRSGGDVADGSLFICAAPCDVYLQCKKSVESKQAGVPISKGKYKRRGRNAVAHAARYASGIPSSHDVVDRALFIVRRSSSIVRSFPMFLLSLHVHASSDHEIAVSLVCAPEILEEDDGL